MKPLRPADRLPSFRKRVYHTVRPKVVLQGGRFHYLLPEEVSLRFKTQADTMQIRHVSGRRSASRTRTSKKTPI